MSDLDKDPMFNSLRDVNDAVENKIDIKPLVRSIIKGFDSLEGLGNEAVQLYTNIQGDANKVRLMVEFFRMVNNCSEAEEDDLPDDLKKMKQTYMAAAAAVAAEAAGNHGQQSS